ncbi:hypothetical protein HNP02_003169, partial [Mycobacterium sp. AZCC_0083]|nr:hypothetical protein [Mycobacterium sp. AZCC_0083]
MADDFDLTQPVGIDAEAWHAITAHRDRLKDSAAQGQFSDPYIADPHKSFTPAQLLGYALDKPLQFP